MPRFVCDVMLGSLARWLRLLGHDCAYSSSADDVELAELARREGRWLLTRDRALAAVGPRTMLVAAERLEEQLAEVLSRHRLAVEPGLARARCAECNGELRRWTGRRSRGGCRPTCSRPRPAWACAGCGRVYWAGSHGRRIAERIERVAEAVRRRPPPAL